MNDIAEYNRLGGIPPDAPWYDEPDLMGDRQQSVENHTDYLLEECKAEQYAYNLIVDYELIETNAAMMAAVANWSGSSADAADVMRKLHVILADGLQIVAESEVGQ